jgi:hypothetical protein
MERIVLIEDLSLQLIQTASDAGHQSLLECLSPSKAMNEVLIALETVSKAGQAAESDMLAAASMFPHTGVAVNAAVL